jgi:hypothetical protein
MGLAELEKDLGGGGGESKGKDVAALPGLSGLAKDTSKMTLGRVGQIAGEELAKIPGRTVENVKELAEGIMHPNMSVMLPLTLGRGPGAPMRGPGVVSRVGATAAGRMLDDPKPTAAGNLATAAKAATVAGAWEAMLGVVPFLKIPKTGTPSLKDFAGRVSAYEHATEAPMKAYEAIKDRVPPGKWMFIPTINPKQAITAKEAAEGLSKLQYLEYETARKEIKAELDRLDIWRGGLAGKPNKGPRPYAGFTFEQKTEPRRFRPSQLSRGGAEVAGALKSPATRMATDVAATEEGPGGIPLGTIPFIPFLEAGGNLKDYARHWIHR